MSRRNGLLFSKRVLILGVLRNTLQTEWKCVWSVCRVCKYVPEIEAGNIRLSILGTQPNWNPLFFWLKLRFCALNGKRITLSQIHRLRFSLWMLRSKKSLSIMNSLDWFLKIYSLQYLKTKPSLILSVQIHSSFITKKWHILYYIQMEFSIHLNHSPWTALHQSDLTVPKRHSSPVRGYIIMTGVISLLICLLKITTYWYST